MWEKYREQILKEKRLDEDWYIVGIDLGTTNSVISYMNSKTLTPEPIDLSNGFGKVPMPSVVQYRDDTGIDEWVIGEEAYNSLPIYPETTILSVKRKMGNGSGIKIKDRNYMPEEIASKILQELIEHLRLLNPKMQLAGVVVSVPYDFDDAAKKATMKACQLAGLSDSLICLIEEPKAAALAYNFRHEFNEKENILVFDFGGGTLDLTIFHVEEKTDDEVKLKVISEGGKADHGGDHVDAFLLEQFYQWIEEANGTSYKELSKETLSDVILRARETKERLSGVKKYRVPFTFCVPPFIKEISRETLESKIDSFINQTRKLVQQALQEAYNGPLTPNKIDKVLLEGGSSRMPWVKQLLLTIFNDEEKIYYSDSPALDISIGATYYAAMKMGLLEHPEVSTSYKSIDFEATVPHDLGLEVEFKGEKVFHPMIYRGTPYSLARKTKIFTLSGDSPKDMTTLNIKLLERVNKKDKIHQCKLVGEVFISGLPERPSGKTQVQVTLLTTEDGGLVKGFVKDLGFSNLFDTSGKECEFIPNRNEAIHIEL